VFYCVDSKWPIISIFFYEKQKVIRDKIIHKTISINKMYYIILEREVFQYKIDKKKKLVYFFVNDTALGKIKIFWTLD
jgi:hypothetical protein